METTKQIIIIEKVDIAPAPFVKAEVEGNMDVLSDAVYSAMLVHPFLAQVIMKAAETYNITLTKEMKARLN